jgi:[protein-PII] uridylyltransferase
VLGALAGAGAAQERLEAKPPQSPRASAFTIHPAVFVDNHASARYTVVEVNARDRPALLSGLAGALYESRAAIHSAHIATYGERAVDVFYLTGLDGARIESPARLAKLKSRLLAAAAGPDAAQRAA